MLKILQLNIFQGIFLDRVVEFVKQQDFDILHFQEVSAGKMSKGGEYNYPKDIAVRSFKVNKKYAGVDVFEELKKGLGMDGRYVPTTKLVNDPRSHIGNATFFKSDFKLVNFETIWLKDFFEVTEDFTDIPKMPRAALLTEFEKEGKRLATINTHLAWGPNASDEQYKIDQAKILFERIIKLKKPYILTGDFNVSPETQTASMFDAVGRNFLKESHITNTLNPRIHSAKILFPEGRAVDYIFASDGLGIKEFRMIEDIDLSDHFGLQLEFSIQT